MGRICRALSTRCVSPLWPRAAERLSRPRDRRPRELALHSTRRRHAVQGHGVEARASSRARYADRAGRRVREWQGLTLIAQRPQRRGEQHRAWASIVGTLPSPGHLAGYRSRQISRPIDFPMGSRSLPMGRRSLPMGSRSLCCNRSTFRKGRMRGTRAEHVTGCAARRAPCG